MPQAAADALGGSGLSPLMILILVVVIFLILGCLLDSLSILPWVDAGPVLDIGTGAGLPGLPLAAVRPDLDFALLDSNGKKIRFVRQAVGELGLDNVEVIKVRVEAFDRPGRYARIISRAFSTLADMVEHSARLLAPDGCWLAMKGAAPHAEIRDLPAGLEALIEGLHVPGEVAARHLVVIRELLQHGGVGLELAGLGLREQINQAPR